jgi:hypothetical protein
MVPFILHNSGFKSSPNPQRSRVSHKVPMTDAGADAGAGGAGASGPPAPHEAWETPWDASGVLGIDVISPSEVGIYPMISQEITIKIRDISRNYYP